MRLNRVYLETKKNDSNKFSKLKELLYDLLVYVRIILDTAQIDPAALKEVINSLRPKIESSEEQIEKLTGPDEVNEESKVILNTIQVQN